MNKLVPVHGCGDLATTISILSTFNGISVLQSDHGNCRDLHVKLDKIRCMDH